MRNKPNFHRPGWVGGAYLSLQVCVIAPNKPNFGAGRVACGEPIVQNKPNSPTVQMDANTLQVKGLGRFLARDRLYETKPFMAPAEPGGAGCTNKANFPPWGGVGCGRLSIAPNKANLPRTDRTGRGRLYKQSQFPAGREWAAAGGQSRQTKPISAHGQERGGTAHAADCAKQSQLAGTNGRGEAVAGGNRAKQSQLAQSPAGGKCFAGKDLC